ncbi:hypothetical protein [Dactylosporangium maewongense]
MSVAIADALVRIRAYAHAQERSLNDVAADIVARRLRFDENQDQDRG